MGNLTLNDELKFYEQKIEEVQTIIDNNAAEDIEKMKGLLINYKHYRTVVLDQIKKESIK